MAGEYVKSAGAVGLELRSAGRSYGIVGTPVANYRDLYQNSNNLNRHSNENDSRRRILRGDFTEGMLGYAVHLGHEPEVAFPNSVINPRADNYFAILGNNTHTSPIPEWDNVYDFWRHEMTNNHKSPLQRIREISQKNEDNIMLTRELTLEDTHQLHTIWKPFGWQQEGIELFIKNYRTEKGRWFSGVRDRSTGKLLSACTGEQLENSVEASEFGTYHEYVDGERIDYEGRGLCTMAVAGLVAQIANDLVYKTGVDTFPMIYAELNMASTSHILARKLGFTIPGVELTPGLENTPRQVLRYNVPVIDGEPNKDFPGIGLSRSEAETEELQYLRNFIFGVVPYERFFDYYNQQDTSEIINLYEK